MPDNSSCYNLFGNEKAGELTSAFLNTSFFYCEDLMEIIINLLEMYHLSSLCNDISFDNVGDCFGFYNYSQKQLLINVSAIKNCISKVSIDDYFIKANMLRIALHEIKHILQYKMLTKKDNQLYKLFETEFHYYFNMKIRPSEINAEIDSLLTVLKAFDKSNPFYSKQLSYTANLIFNYYKSEYTIEEFCFQNNLHFTNISSLERILYGFKNNQINLVLKK